MKFEWKYKTGEQKKKHKAGIDEQLRMVHIKLSGLEENFRTIVSREIRELRVNPNNKRSRERAKNALYSLMVVRQALDQLYDIDTTQNLNKSMNALSVTLQRMNGINERSSKVKSKRLNKEIGKMNLSADKRDTSGVSIFNDDIDTLIGDDVLNSLLKGSSINSVLKHPDEAMQNLEENISIISQNDLEELFDGMSEEEIENLDPISDLDDFNKFL